MVGILLVVLEMEEKVVIANLEMGATVVMEVMGELVLVMEVMVEMPDEKLFRIPVACLYRV